MQDARNYTDCDETTTLAEFYAQRGNGRVGRPIPMVKSDDQNRGLHLLIDDSGNYLIGDEGVWAEYTSPVDPDRSLFGVIEEWEAVA